MRFSEYLFNFMRDNPYIFLGIPVIKTSAGYSFEYYQHVHMILNLYDWQYNQAILEKSWFYTPLRPHRTLKNLPDGLFYNILTNELITIQYKYRGVDVLQKQFLYKLVSDYKDTDLIILGLSNIDLYNKQLETSNNNLHKIIFQNYNYLQYELIDPNVTIEIFNWYGKNINNDNFCKYNDIFFSDLDKHHYNKTLNYSQEKEQLINLIKNDKSTYHNSLVCQNPLKDKISIE